METVLRYAELYQTEIAIIGGVIVLLLVGWLAWRAVHRRRTRTVERPSGTIRRPVYTDGVLLDDLRAHGDPARRHGGETTTAATGQSARTEETRRLNDTLAALEGSPVLLDLDADPGADLEDGRAVILTGRLRRHAASDAAELLELSTPLLERASSNGHHQDDSRDTTTLTPVRRDQVTTAAAPLVVVLEHAASKRHYLMTLPREHLRVDDPTRSDAQVSVLAVVERTLGRRDALTVEDYLGPHLTDDGRSVLADRDLAETVTALSDVTHDDLAARDLRFRGPGALLTPAAIHR